MNSLKQGFTIVELTIVISVIAILATITVVSYNGSQSRAEYARAQTDMKHINDAIDIYRAQKGVYPSAGTTTFTDASSSLNVLVTEKYLDTSTILVAKTGYSYTYRTDAAGTDYALLRVANPISGTLPSVETSGNSRVKAASTYAGANKAWGYWSSGAASW
ncbi:MAG TPA: prepilin-type N-terminal cleavage/methylation domain-containing protein [Candidatus Saccharimonadales bacterium]